MNAVVLHLYMKRLVIHLEAAGGLALVATRGPERPPDRLPLHLLGGDVGNLLQREARRRGSAEPVNKNETVGSRD